MSRFSLRILHYALSKRRPSGRRFLYEYGKSPFSMNRASFFIPAYLLVIVAIATTFSMSLLLPFYFEGASGMIAFLAGTPAMMAQAEGFASAVAVATAIAAVGTVTAFIYGHKRQRLANAERASAPAVASIEESLVVPEAAIAPQDDQVLLPADVSALRAVDLMKAPYVVSAEDSVREVMAHLIERKTSGLPVVGTKGSIVGFVTDGDLMAALVKPNVQDFDLTASLAVIRDSRNFDERFEETLGANVMEITLPPWSQSPRILRLMASARSLATSAPRRCLCFPENRW